MSAPWTSNSRALSRGRAGRSAIRFGGSSKSKRSTRIGLSCEERSDEAIQTSALDCFAALAMTRRGLPAQIRPHNFGRLLRWFARCDGIRGVHAGDHATHHRVIVVELGMRSVHDEEL